MGADYLRSFADRQLGNVAYVLAAAVLTVQLELCVVQEIVLQVSLSESDVVAGVREVDPVLVLGRVDAGGCGSSGLDSSCADLVGGKEVILRRRLGYRECGSDRHPYHCGFAVLQCEIPDAAVKDDVAFLCGLAVHILAARCFDAAHIRRLHGEAEFLLFIFGNIADDRLPDDDRSELLPVGERQRCILITVHTLKGSCKPPVRLYL